MRMKTWVEVIIVTMVVLKSLQSQWLLSLQYTRSTMLLLDASLICYFITAYATFHNIRNI